MTTVPAKYQAEQREYEDEDWLREQYVEQEKSVKEVAAETDVCRETISNKMEANGIDRRPPPSAKPAVWERSGDEWTYVGESETIETTMDETTEEIGSPDWSQL